MTDEASPFRECGRCGHEMVRRTVDGQTTHLCSNIECLHAE